LLLILKGGALLFALLIAVVSFIGLLEYCEMTLPGRGVESILISTTAVVISLLFYLHSAAAMTFAIALFLLSIAVHTLFRFSDIKQAASEAALLFFGIVYVPYLLGYLILLRNHPSGLNWILLILFIVMSGDSAAYFFGSRFGKHKLYPAVSPNKSVEGALFGLAGSVTGALVAKLIYFSELSVANGILAALLIGTLGQLGDLFESMIKRSCGVKDSGRIIPGHGGILDRLDSILFAAPATYYYATFVSDRLFH
jgi:phosphatidate cytidylyltransferase